MYSCIRGRNSAILMPRGLVHDLSRLPLDLLVLVSFKGSQCQTSASDSQEAWRPNVDMEGKS